MSVSIRAFTVWGSANVSNALLRSPPSTPEAPLDPRAFVSFVRNQSDIPTVSLLASTTTSLNYTLVIVPVVFSLPICTKGAEIHFRWSPPAVPNGELTGYRINFCWHKKNETRRNSDCQDIGVKANVTEFTARHLITNENYVFTVGKISPNIINRELIYIFFKLRFQVQASTKMGYGPETAPLMVSTSSEKAIPHLVIFTANVLWLADLDKHSSLNPSLGMFTALHYV